MSGTFKVVVVAGANEMKTAKQWPSRDTGSNKGVWASPRTARDDGGGRPDHTKPGGSAVDHRQALAMGKQYLFSIPTGPGSGQQRFLLEERGRCHGELRGKIWPFPAVNSWVKEGKKLAARASWARKARGPMPRARFARKSFNAAEHDEGELAPIEDYSDGRGWSGRRWWHRRPRFRSKKTEKVGRRASIREIWGRCSFIGRVGLRTLLKLCGAATNLFPATRLPRGRMLAGDKERFWTPGKVSGVYMLAP